MFESKYGKFLTILLIIIVTAIVILLGFLIFDLIKTSSDDKDAEEAVSQFGQQNRIRNNIQNTENVSVDIPAPPTIEPPQENQNGNSSNQGTTSTTNKYKGFTWIGNIEIPKTGISYPILNEVTPKSIEVAVAVLYPMNLQRLNQPGNVTIVGHNYRNSSFFSNNKNLNEGDKIYITDLASGERVEYTIYNKYITTAEDAEFMIRDTDGRREISLSTCTENVKNRLVIWARAD